MTIRLKNFEDKHKRSRNSGTALYASDIGAFLPEFSKFGITRKEVLSLKGLKNKKPKSREIIIDNNDNINDEDNKLNVAKKYKLRKVSEKIKKNIAMPIKPKAKKIISKSMQNSDDEQSYHHQLLNDLTERDPIQYMKQYINDLKKIIDHQDQKIAILQGNLDVLTKKQVKAIKIDATKMYQTNMDNDNENNNNNNDNNNDNNDGSMDEKVNDDDNGDRRITELKIQEAFRESDYDKYGQLNKSKFEDALGILNAKAEDAAKTLGWDTNNIDELFDNADLDNDGYLTFNEFRFAILGNNAKKLDLYTLRKLFDQCDKDGNETLSVKEFNKICRATGFGQNNENIDEYFKNVDINNSGNIDFNELCLAMLGKEPTIKDTNTVMKQIINDYNDDSNNDDIRVNKDDFIQIAKTIGIPKDIAKAKFERTKKFTISIESAKKFVAQLKNE